MAKQRLISEQLIHSQEAELKRLKDRLARENRGFPTTITADSNFDTFAYSFDCKVDSCDPVASGYPDADGDGVSDVCDLDDDNDGILDTDEFNCASGFIDLAQSFSDNSSSPGTISNIYPFSGVTVDLSYELFGSFLIISPTRNQKNSSPV